MNSWRRLLPNLLAHLFLIMLLLGAQTTVWPQSLPGVVSPALWVPSLVYFSFFRNSKITILFCYLLAPLLSCTTICSAGLLGITLVCSSFFTRWFRNRISLDIDQSFALMSGVTILTHTILLILFSQMLEERPIGVQGLWSAILSAFITLPFSFFLLRVLQRIDDKIPIDELTATDRSEKVSDEWTS